MAPEKVRGRTLHHQFIILGFLINLLDKCLWDERD